MSIGLDKPGLWASWQDKAYTDTMRELNTANREYLYTLLESAGMSYIPSQTNFVLADVKQDAAAALSPAGRGGNYCPQRRRLWALSTPQDHRGPQRGSHPSGRSTPSLLTPRKE